MPEILIVDDERAIREGLKMTLSSEGFEVRTARDGDDALKKIAERKPDLVLLDVMMPRMNGFLACEAIRKEDNLLPVIFLTAKDSEADQVRGIGLGADDYISKDCSDAVMLACIRRSLSRSKSIVETVEKKSGALIRVGKVTVDPKSYKVMLGKDEVARLTKTEVDLLDIQFKAWGLLHVRPADRDVARAGFRLCRLNALHAHLESAPEARPCG